jgi:outer membrane protein assembly factor BamE (lipoprotein component of BamABCDE complex)
VKGLLSLGCLALILAGCVGGSGEIQWRFRDQYNSAQKNRQSLASIRTGMSQDEVRSLMGEPEMVESYPREAIWFYRTDLTGGVQASVDSDFTALIFNDQKRLTGWGKNLFAGGPGRASMIGAQP